MKGMGIFLLIALALFSVCGDTAATSAGIQANCDKYVGGCTKIYFPVCGTDGQTYANECTLCMLNRERQVPVLIENSGPC